MIRRLSGTHKLVLFSLVPIIAYIDSLRDGYRKSSQILIMLFCGLVGWLCDSYNPEMDLSWYIGEAKEQLTAGDSYYYMVLTNYLTFGESTGKDLYFETMVFLVSHFTSNFHYVFLCTGLIYGFFYAKSYGIICKHLYKYNQINRYYALILLFLFISMPYTNLCSVRFWTASWITIYVCLKIHIEKRYAYIVLLLFSVFIHASFLIAVGLVSISLLVPKGNSIGKILAIAAILSIPFSYLSLLFGDVAVNYAPLFIQKYVRGYFETSIEGNTATGSGFYWVAEIFGQLDRLLRVLLMILLLYKRYKLKDIYQPFYICTLIFLTFSNFLMAIPTVGGRFGVVASILFIFMWSVTFTKSEYKKIINKIPIIYSFTIFFFFYLTIPSTTGFLGLITPPLLSFFRFM